MSTGLILRIQYESRETQKTFPVLVSSFSSSTSRAHEQYGVLHHPTTCACICTITYEHTMYIHAYLPYGDVVVHPPAHCHYVPNRMYTSKRVHASTPPSLTSTMPGASQQLFQDPGNVAGGESAVFHTIGPPSCEIPRSRACTLAVDRKEVAPASRWPASRSHRHPFSWQEGKKRTHRDESPFVFSPPCFRRRPFSLCCHRRGAQLIDGPTLCRYRRNPTSKYPG